MFPVRLGKRQIPVRLFSSTFLLVLLLLAAFAWRVDRLNFQSLWRDEVDAIYFAVQPLPGLISMFTTPGHNGPLYFFLLRFWFRLVGSSEFALRFPSVVAGVLSVTLFWLVIRRLLTGYRRSFVNYASFLGALLLAFNPYQLWYSQEGKMYAIIVCLTLLSKLCWLEGIYKGGWRRWAGYFLFTTLCLYLHVLAALIIPLHVIWFLIAWPVSKQRWRGYGMSLGLLTLPYLPLALWQLDTLLNPNYSAGYPFVPLQEAVQLLLLVHARSIMPASYAWWLAPIYFLALAGVLMGAQALKGEEVPQGEEEQGGLSPVRRVGLVVSWFVVPLLSLHTISLFVPLFVDRYLIWIGPAFCLCLGLGFQVVRQNSGRWAFLVGQGLLASIILFWLSVGINQKSIPIKADLRSAVAYIEARRTPQQLLVLQIPHMQYSYRYYTSDYSFEAFDFSANRLAPWSRGIHTNRGEPDATARRKVDQEMSEIILGYKEIWILSTEVEMWDSRRLMDEWLTVNGELVEQSNFQLVEVRRYRLSRKTPLRSELSVDDE